MRMPAGCPCAPAKQPALSACSAVDLPALPVCLAVSMDMPGCQQCLALSVLVPWTCLLCQRAHAMDVPSSRPAWLPAHAYDELQDAWLPEMKCDKSWHMRLVKGASAA
jgi:hypothetical protein